MEIAAQTRIFFGVMTHSDASLSGIGLRIGIPFASSAVQFPNWVEFAHRWRINRGGRGGRGGRTTDFFHGLG